MPLRIFLLCLIALAITSASAMAQTQIADLVLDNGRTMEAVEILQEEDGRIEVRTGEIKVWIPRDRIEAIEVIGEIAPWNEPKPDASWLSIWTPRTEKVSKVQTVTEEGRKWNRISSQYFHLHFTDTADRTEVLELARVQDNVYEFLHKRTGRAIPYPIKAYLVPEKVGARCDFETMSIYITERSSLKYWLSLYMHEATHLFNKGRVQNWWSGEFMCAYHHLRSLRRENDIWKFYRAAAEIDTTPWASADNMDRSELAGGKWDTRMRMAGAVYFFIEETYGVGKLAEFWDRNCERGISGNVQPRFESVFGKSIEELQSEYRLFYRLETVPHIVARGSDASPALLRSVVTELASARYRGRKAGDSGCDDAAEYIAGLFRECNLKPAGDDGSYFQTLTLPHAEFHGSSFRLNSGKAFRVYRDYRPVCGNEGRTVTGQIVFVGYGLSEPDYDDYENIDVSGKIVLALRGAPGERFKRDFGTKVGRAADRGAIGLLIADTSNQGRPFDLDRKCVNPPSGGIPALHVSRDIGNQILAGYPTNVDQLKEGILQSKKPHSFPTGATAELSVAMTHKPDARSSNVLGILEGGNDTGLKDYIVVCAHYDGQGLHEEGRHFPGANDNASGVAALIGIAHAMKPIADDLDFSILFAAWTGEETGLRGSNHFCERPTIPLDRIRETINLDMVGRGSDRKLHVQTQDENSPVFVGARDSAKDLRIKLTSRVTETPGSDAQSFATHGVHAMFFVTGDQDAHSEKDTPDRMSWDTLENVVGLVAHSLTRQSVSALLAQPRPAVPQRITPARFKPRQGVVVDYSAITRKSGARFDGILVGDSRCTKAFIKSKLGPPEEETDQWLNYKAKYGLDFCMAADMDVLIEIRLNEGFEGKLESGVSLSSSREDVFRTYGGPVAETSVDSFHLPVIDHRTLYRKGTFSHINYLYKGLRFSFDGDRIQQIVVFRKKDGVPPEDALPIAGSAVPETVAEPPRSRWGPVVRTDTLWNYVEKLWLYWYFTVAALLIPAFLMRAYVRRLYYYWRPLPEGRLLLIRGPTGGDAANINLWYESRRLRKRRLLIGSGPEADICLSHKSIDARHALITARRIESRVVTSIEKLGDGRVCVNDSQQPVMPLVENATIKVGRYRFKYEQPGEYRQVQVRYRNGRVMEGVPTSWDINAAGFTLLPSKAPSWIDARFVRFGKLKGIYFLRDWDEDVREKMVKGVRKYRNSLMTLRFADGEVISGYPIGDYAEHTARFYFFPRDQSGDTVYMLVERGSVRSVTRRESTA